MQQQLSKGVIRGNHIITLLNTKVKILFPTYLLILRMTYNHTKNNP